MRQTLVKLNNKKKKLSGRWITDVVWSDMSLQSYLINCFDHSLGIELNLLFIIDAKLDIFESLGVTIVRFNQTCKDNSIV